jgi:hypothetical protein
VCVEILAIVLMWERSVAVPVLCRKKCGNKVPLNAQNVVTK